MITHEYTVYSNSNNDYHVYTKTSMFLHKPLVLSTVVDTDNSKTICMTISNSGDNWYMDMYATNTISPLNLVFKDINQALINSTGTTFNPQSQVTIPKTKWFS